MLKKESEKRVNGQKERRRNLVSFLRPQDVILFEETGDYFFVRSVGEKKIFVTGLYKYSSGKEELKRMSLERIADMDPLVAYLRKI